jgi:poly(3-hydroxybutyrate) depolymerase
MKARMAQRIAILSGTLLLSGIPAIAASTQTRTVVCNETKYRYLFLVPEKEGALPALLLLHGSADSPETMMEAWEGLAKKEQFLLIAPELPMRKDFAPQAPKVFVCLVEDAKHLATIDVKHVYVFGNSLGGSVAYYAAAFDSDYFAAVAVHARGIDPQDDDIMDNAKRRIPIAIYMGERDPLVSLENVRRTRDLLLGKGFPVRYVELKDHDHDYYRVAKRINPDIWNFLKDRELP